MLLTIHKKTRVAVFLIGFTALMLGGEVKLMAALSPALLRWPLSSLSLIYGIPSRHADINLIVREHKSSMP